MNITQTTLVSILPLAIGGIFHSFRGLLEKKENFENRCNRLLAISKDKIAVALTRLLKVEMRRGFDDIAIEDGEIPSPLYNDISSLISKHTKLSYRLSLRRDIINLCRGSYFFGIFAGILGILVVHFLPGHEIFVTWACLIIVAFEVLAVRTQFQIERRSEDDEEIL
jgi:hypothetical protein